MQNKVISSWIRQARYKSKKLNIHCDISISDVLKIIEDFEEKCAYCSKNYETFDHPFSLKDSKNCVPANILPCCKKCKKLKKNNDLVWMFLNKVITNESYVKLLQYLFKQKGGIVVKEHVKKLTGYNNE